eukprot:1420806-Alexandrium_andersonii.AAC.1
MRALRAELPLLDWVVFREPLALLESEKWPTLRLYAAALRAGVGNTLGLENAFNDLRDNEARGARNK